MSYFVTISVNLNLVMTSTEMVVMKYIYIYKFSRIAEINENFITTTFTLFNAVIIAINIIIRLVTKEVETSPWYFNHNLQLPPQFTYNQRTDVQKNGVR